MQETFEKDRWQFAYRMPWWKIVRAGLGAATALGTGLSRAIVGYPLAPPMAGTISALALIGLGTALAAITIGMVTIGLRHPRRILVDDDAISLPRAPWPAEYVRLGWDGFTAMRTAAFGNERQLELIWPEGSILVSRAMLRDPAAFDRLRDLVVERLAKSNVPVEDWSEVERVCRRRPQFSIAYLLIVVTFVAMLLGTRSYIYGNCSSDAVMEIGVALGLLLAGPWLLVAAPQWLRVFALGFVLGFWLEWIAVVGWLEFSPAGANGGWYPLSAILWRIAVASPSATWLTVGVRMCMLGATLSGVLAGFAAMVGRRLVRRYGRRQGIVGAAATL
jgi:hypothetical protein